MEVGFNQAGGAGIPSTEEVGQVEDEAFDQRALQTAFGGVRERRQAMHEAVHEVVAEAAPQFSPQGRRKLSDWRKDEQ